MTLGLLCHVAHLYDSYTSLLGATDGCLPLWEVCKLPSGIMKDNPWREDSQVSYSSGTSEPCAWSAWCLQQYELILTSGDQPRARAIAHNVLGVS